MNWMNNWCICWFFTHIFLLGILIFKGFTVWRLYKSFGVTGLTIQRLRELNSKHFQQWRILNLNYLKMHSHSEVQKHQQHVMCYRPYGSQSLVFKASFSLLFLNKQYLPKYNTRLGSFKQFSKNWLCFIFIHVSYVHVMNPTWCTIDLQFIQSL
jgi:hypothetical protein